jgi:hypothetical protein
MEQNITDLHYIKTAPVGRSYASHVAEFTYETMDGVPAKPEPFDLKQMRFLCRMVMSELMEGVATLTDDPVAFLRECLDTDLPSPRHSQMSGKFELLKEHMDMGVDIIYYVCNIFARNGMNLDPIFEEVHKANMNKRHPDGKFHRRKSDGKIEKPPGFKEPELDHIVKRQLEQGSWVHE